MEQPLNILQNDFIYLGIKIILLLQPVILRFQTVIPYKSSVHLRVYIKKTTTNKLITIQELWKL